MMSRDEFALAGRTLLDELSALCVRASSQDLASIPDFAIELAEVRSIFANNGSSSSQLLAASFGLVDEFASGRWDDVMAEAYGSFVTMFQAGEQRNGRDGG
jgi:hypothetical protein